MSNCKYCNKEVHLQNGVHMGEFEMNLCVHSEQSNLALVPKYTESWHQPAKRIRQEAPFVVGGVA
ncbi:MAG: hypothetical protein ACTHWH_05945 [Marinobacter sp.]